MQQKLATFQVVEETEWGWQGCKEEEEEKEGTKEEKGGRCKFKETVEHSAWDLENSWERGERPLK